MKTRLLKIFSLGVYFLVFYLLVDVFLFLSLPVNSGGEEKKVFIQKGFSFKQVVQLLKKEGLLRSSKKFYFMAKFFGSTDKVKAGEYSMNTSMLPQEILQKILRGEVIRYRVTIPEGYTIRQIAAYLENQGIIKDQEGFLRLASSPEFIVSLGIEGERLEGYLFPDTYFFPKGLPPEEIIRTMVQNFQQVYRTDFTLRAAELGLTDREIIILASIIEKETGLVEERPIISAVFHNRLKRGIALCSDPTVIYGLGEFDGNLRKEDLEKETPYNTYLIKGLPPGPISNPGESSILAALYPAPVEYLYFVSRNNGTHYFSTSLREHNEAVWRYQKRLNWTPNLK
jgi:UPF0755 protein